MGELCIPDCPICGGIGWVNVKQDGYWLSSPCPNRPKYYGSTGLELSLIHI